MVVTKNGVMQIYRVKKRAALGETTRHTQQNV